MTRSSGEGDAPMPEGVYEAAPCAAGCGESWQRWCRGCNNVYCPAHAAPGAGHPCREGKPALPTSPASRAGGTP